MRELLYESLEALKKLDKNNEFSILKENIRKELVHPQDQTGFVPIGHLVRMKSKWGTWKAKFFSSGHTAFYVNKQWKEDISKIPVMKDLDVVTDYVYVKIDPPKT